MNLYFVGIRTDGKVIFISFDAGNKNIICSNGHSKNLDKNKWRKAKNSITIYIKEVLDLQSFPQSISATDYKLSRTGTQFPDFQNNYTVKPLKSNQTANSQKNNNSVLRHNIEIYSKKYINSRRYSMKELINIEKKNINPKQIIEKNLDIKHKNSILHKVNGSLTDNRVLINTKIGS